MPPAIDLLGPRWVALTLIFGVLTLGMAVLVSLLYLVFSALIRQQDDVTRRAPQPGRTEPDGPDYPRDPHRTLHPRGNGESVRSPLPPGEDY